MKTCSKCKETKPLSEFSKNKRSKDGLDSRCKECVRAYSKYHYENNKEKYHERAAQWREDNRELLNERFRTRYRKTQTEYILNRNKTDPLFYQKSNFGRRVAESLKYIRETGKISENDKMWEEVVGYTLKDLAEHLQSLFTEGMSWSNYGEWQLDHIIPISAFNIKEIGDEEFLKCWDLKNLQPLWKKDNIRKSNNIGPQWGNA